MTEQHLQPGVAQPAERPSRLGLHVMVIFSVDVMGLSVFFILALTSLSLRFLVFLRLRQGLGISHSSSCGLRDCFNDFRSKSGVYGMTKG